MSSLVGQPAALDLMISPASIAVLSCDLNLVRLDGRRNHCRVDIAFRLQHSVGGRRRPDSDRS